MERWLFLSAGLEYTKPNGPSNLSTNFFLSWLQRLVWSAGTGLLFSSSAGVIQEVMNQNCVGG